MSHYEVESYISKTSKKSHDGQSEIPPPPYVSSLSGLYRDPVKLDQNLFELCLDFVWTFLGIYWTLF